MWYETHFFRFYHSCWWLMSSCVFFCHQTCANVFSLLEWDQRHDNHTTGKMLCVCVCGTDPSANWQHSSANFISHQRSPTQIKHLPQNIKLPPARVSEQAGRSWTSLTSSPPLQRSWPEEVNVYIRRTFHVSRLKGTEGDGSEVAAMRQICYRVIILIK